MITKELKSTKAITLIAMVISILVLLILAGVSLALVVGETGITQRAVTARKTYDIAGAKEQVELLVEGYIGDYYGKKYTSGEATSEDIGTYVATQLASDTTVGDYTLETSGVNVSLKKGEETVAKGKINSSGGLEWSNSLVATWEQDGTSVTNGDVTLTVGQAVTGYSVDVEINSATQTISNWYVLGAKNGELLITTNTSYENVTLSGIEDYVRGVAKLNTVAAKYSDGDLADSVSSINVDDINRVTGYNPATANYGVGNIWEYGNEVTYFWKGGDYPYYSGSNSLTGNATFHEDGFFFPLANGWTFSEVSSFATTENKEKITTLTNTGYEYGGYEKIDSNSQAFALLFSNTGHYPMDSGSYWLGSQYVRCETQKACFGLFVLGGGQVHFCTMACSDETQGSSSLGLRPVVALEYSVNVTSAGVVSK